MTESAKHSIQIRGISGETVVTLTMLSDQCCHHLHDKISSVLYICTCKILLIAGTEKMRKNINLERYLRKLAPDNIVTMIVKTIDVADTSIDQLFRARVCFKCMKEAGASAEAILEYVVRNKLALNAVELRRAGFSLSELVQARRKLPSSTRHPLVTEQSLFDSQMKEAGYSAENFRTAGYQAHQLTYPYCWRDDEFILDETRWVKTRAFFSAAELRRAGYDDTDLRRARYRRQHREVLRRNLHKQLTRIIATSSGALPRQQRPCREICFQPATNER